MSHLIRSENFIYFRLSSQEFISQEISLVTANQKSEKIGQEGILCPHAIFFCNFFRAVFFTNLFMKICQHNFRFITFSYVKVSKNGRKVEIRPKIGYFSRCCGANFFVFFSLFFLHQCIHRDHNLLGFSINSLKVSKNGP